MLWNITKNLMEVKMWRYNRKKTTTRKLYSTNPCHGVPAPGRAAGTRWSRCLPTLTILWFHEPKALQTIWFDLFSDALSWGGPPITLTLTLIPFNLNSTSELLKNKQIKILWKYYKIKFQLNLLHTIKIVYKTSPLPAWLLLRQQNRTMAM